MIDIGVGLGFNYFALDMRRNPIKCNLMICGSFRVSWGP